VSETTGILWLPEREKLNMDTFMTTKRLSIGKTFRRNIVICAFAVAVLGGAGNPVQAQTVPADLSPGLQQVANLAKAGMSDDFIETYIANSGRTYTLSVDDIIYLHSQGVSDNVMKVLMQNPTAAGSNPAPATPPPAVPPPAVAPAPTDVATPPPVNADSTATVSTPDPGGAAPPSLGYFQTQLAPYGNWVDVPGYGSCWQPAVNPGWRPYYDGGHWVYTDSGWYWQSDYPWGDISFHYGRWIFTSVGWVWVPGYDYAPAWVVWRHADDDGCIGWAPLPPGANFIGGAWWYHGGRVGLDFDFGLGANYFTFVDYDHFWVHDLRSYALPGYRVDLVFRHSVFENHFRDDHGHFFNGGLDHDRMVRFTHQDFHPEREQDLRHQEVEHNLGVRNTDIIHYQSNHGRAGSFQNGNHDGSHNGNSGWDQHK
jgi:hypothetical protein